MKAFMRRMYGAASAVRRLLVVLLLAEASGLGTSYLVRADDAPDRLRDLRIVSSARRLEGACLGPACDESLYYAAYQRVTRRSDLTLDELLDAYGRALPAGRIYVGAAILKKDHQRGESLLRELAKNWMPIPKQSGCMVDLTTLGSAARLVLANNGLPSGW
jgi:hypothetical protein